MQKWLLSGLTCQPGSYSVGEKTSLPWPLTHSLGKEERLRPVGSDPGGSLLFAVGKGVLAPRRVWHGDLVAAFPYFAYLSSCDKASTQTRFVALHIYCY
ncbi:hypothetical protein CEXT_612981 [Caerostris extrusa]|uniref:Uncharacterized protein n=1 Tax=Caerostris extrusa TaxID=172846 RepID=A0AAV4V2N4_CAEEX|nr:hypothetical protein CEXT_612981 [Caerostris extrusa]